jgi:hypothetical protein
MMLAANIERMEAVGLATIQLEWLVGRRALTKEAEAEAEAAVRTTDRTVAVAVVERVNPLH